MEELAVRLHVGVVAAGDLVLAGEARVGEGVRAEVGRPDLGRGQTQEQQTCNRRETAFSIFIFISVHRVR